MQRDPVSGKITPIMFIKCPESIRKGETSVS